MISFAQSKSWVTFSTPNLLPCQRGRLEAYQPLYRSPSAGGGIVSLEPTEMPL